MKSAANFIDFFVHDILDFTVLQETAHNFSKNDSVFDIREAIQQIIDTLEAKTQIKGITTRKRYLNFETRTHGFMVKTDMKRIQQVILNLYSNAIKFTPRSGKITFQIESLPQGKLLVKVIDNGIGIRKENKRKMFTMFGTIKEENPQGIGLGLCICKKIVNKFGG